MECRRDPQGFSSDGWRCIIWRWIRGVLNSLKEAIEAYRHLCRQVDDRIARLEAMHRGHLACRAGCCDCCVNLTVFSVELYAIASQLAESGTKKMRIDPRVSCGWLEDGLCRIYAVR